MSIKITGLFGVLLLFLFPGNTLHAQQNPGDFTIAFGFNGTDQPRHAEAGAARLRTPVNFRLKVHPKLVVGVDHDSFLAKRGADGEWAKGTGNVVFVVRPEFSAEEVGLLRPTVRLTYSLTLPTASVSKGLGTGRVDHKILGTVRKTVSEEGAAKETMVGVDFGANFAGRQDRSGFKKAGLLNIYFERDLDAAGKYLLHGEVVMTSRADNSPSQIQSTNNVRVKLNPRVSVRVGFIVGITPTAPKAGGYGSIEFTGPKLW